MWGKNNQQARGDVFLGTFHVIHIPLIWTFARCPLGTKGNSGCNRQQMCCADRGRLCGENALTTCVCKVEITG